MILRRLYHDKLAQASYLIGCGMTGEALVVDPNRDIDQYLETAGAQGLRITAVTETHIHADYVSGSRELAHRTGATLRLSDEGGPDWTYGFAAEAGAVLLRHGDSFMVGKVRIDVLHTPGHTPEHLTFLVTDTAGADRPIGALTGDFIFVGDVGRPDLLERAARVEGTMEASARTLFRSLRTFTSEQPDWLQIWPGHGAGSACGKGLSEIPHSTLGYEKLFNRALAVEDEEEFVHQVLAGQPEPPTYFARMKRVNREGPPILDGLLRPERLRPERLERLRGSGAMVVDTRRAPDFARGHLAGTINIPLNRSFSTWAGWLIPPDRDLVLIADAHEAEEAARDLAMIGLENIAGYLPVEAVERLHRQPDALRETRRIDADALERRLSAGEVSVLDVRWGAEWDEGHIPGAVHIPLGHLPQRIDDVPRTLPLVVHCRSGARSAIAASLLQTEGFEEVANLTVGFQGWQDEDRPISRNSARPTAR